jgi:hypothetical protein
MHVSDFCIPEKEFPASKPMRVNRYLRPRGNFLFELLQVRHDPNSIDCFFDALARPLDSATQYARSPPPRLCLSRHVVVRNGAML